MIALSQISPSTLKSEKRNDIKSNKLQTTFLQEVIEGMQDGIMIVSETGKVIYANSNAWRICNQLQQSNHERNTVPAAIWKVCEFLINNCNSFTKINVISDDIIVNDLVNFRIRVRWINLDIFTHSCLSITIENRHESVVHVAESEIKKYQLTPREAEIWLLYRTNYSYKRIAEKLYITLNTVKKHMKNIHAKRSATEECGRCE
jgi:DNA-binding CsgD family transcriptional regulator